MRPDHDGGAAGVPADWWGPVWSSRPEIGLGELIESGLLSLDLAALLWALIESGASVVVAAGPSGAGKSTLLTALLEFLPESKRRVYTRGMYETFDFADGADPKSTAILVNEISAHLPIYLWGSAVRRLFQLGLAGFQFLATCHAESVEELVYGFSASPLRISAVDISSIDLVIFLKAWREESRVHREIDRVVSLRGAATTGVEAITLFTAGAVAMPAVVRAFGFDAGKTSSFEADHDRRIAELWERFAR